MTLEEKAGLCSGEDYWHTKAIERLGIKSIMMADSPNGLRKQDYEADHLGINESIKAVCFPSGCGAACSFDRKMMMEMGETLGKECVCEKVSVVLGPALNIKRSPLCGRNFEYFSEDPFLAGELAAAQVKGIQSQGVAACPKHFAANNQEHRRMSVSSEIDERALREIYLAPFERVVKESKPWTVMSSYNQINGEYVAESKKYLTEILRDQWGFDGCVVSDWGGTADRVKGLAAGLDIEMPTSHGINDKLICKAIAEGTLSEEELDKTVERILTLIDRTYSETAKKTIPLEEDHKKAVEYAKSCIVLLKNDENLLPLRKSQKVVFIGDFAQKPRYQGGGSGHINAFKAPSPIDIAMEAGYDVSFAQGYIDTEEAPDEALTQEAACAAKAADFAVIFAGLPEVFESEGFDREHMNMPENQNRLIDQVCKVQKNVIVVLQNGAPVEMPWADEVSTILETYLCGQGVGEAIVDILYGKTNPSGRLAETIPYKLEDNPSFLSFPGEGDLACYTEGIFVGYRYYTKKKMNVRYPFGHGLSYTSFEYSNMTISKNDYKAGEELLVSVDIKNTGSADGHEVVQLYVEGFCGKKIRPIRELKEFTKVFIKQGEKKTVEFRLDKRAFSYFDAQEKGWRIEPGRYQIEFCENADKIICSAPLDVWGDEFKLSRCTLNTTLGDIYEDENCRDIIEPILEKYKEKLHEAEGGGQASKEAVSNQMVEAMVRYMPLRSLISLGGFKITREELMEIVEKVNRRIQHS